MFKHSDKKIASDNIRKFGQKATNTAHLPIVQTVASTTGYPELGAIISAGQGRQRIAQAR